MKPLGTLVTALALGSAAVVLLTTGSWRVAIRVLLDLLTAAGLIRLAAAQGWIDLASAAVIVLLRQVVSAVLLRPRQPPDAGQ
ncbi:hypothetical protein [Plantactinospora soyae]|uniref:Energy-converting hydrogenase Eha subunit C n=1 Tax=Plantactinospora soyae TaxID=1544732 RepID=A0A927M4S1_9ACTN|nr:hypothetical protein [Plantactinospora soyae]MBE1485453.1 energy-converting hydrogenase Eha subunit C [Plantactinospora soyae]